MNWEFISNWNWIANSEPNTIRIQRVLGLIVFGADVPFSLHICFKWICNCKGVLFGFYFTSWRSTVDYSETMHLIYFLCEIQIRLAIELKLNCWKNFNFVLFAAIVFSIISMISCSGMMNLFALPLFNMHTFLLFFLFVQ